MDEYRLFGPDKHTPWQEQAEEPHSAGVIAPGLERTELLADQPASGLPGLRPSGNFAGGTSARAHETESLTSHPPGSSKELVPSQGQATK